MQFAGEIFWPTSDVPVVILYFKLFVLSRLLVNNTI